MYTSKVSLYVYNRVASKTVNVYLNGTNVAKGSTTATSWYNAYNSTENCTAGSKFNFRTVNGSEYKGWGFLEQGFEYPAKSFGVAGNEKPANGGTVAY